MKIETTLEEIESFKNQIQSLITKNKQLEEQLSKLDEKYLREQAIRLGEKLFRNYFTTVFQKLGFDNKGDDYWNSKVSFNYEELNRYLGDNSWESPRLKIEIATEVSNAFRFAFLSIGVIPVDKIETVKKLLTDL